MRKLEHGLESELGVISKYLAMKEIGRYFRFSRKRSELDSEVILQFENLIDRHWLSKMYGNRGLNELSYPEFRNQRIFGLGIDPNPLFDSDWYLLENPDVQSAGSDPLWHYVKFGELEGRYPNPFFDPFFYRGKHPDLINFDGNLLAHYIRHGQHENRITSSFGELDSLISAVELAKRNFKSVESFLNGVKVDIVIPVFNGWAYTERCLRAIESSVDFDLVNIFVVDDSSTDNTLSELQRYPYVRVLQTSANLGFTRACNFAFEKLNDSSYIFLLNNDTEPVSGFVINALQVMQQNESAGIVGSRLLYSDGSLQECGGIIFQDGTAANYGRGSNPDQVKVRSSRRVDYCSGASILIRNSFLKTIGGFDDVFAPAYYEDTDLSVHFRTLGISTYVSSESNVVHHEGKSHGTNLTDHGKSSQSINRIKFFNKWEESLSRYHGPGDVSLDQAAQRLNNKRLNILWIDVDVPDPTRDSGSVRAMALLEIALELECNVVFVSNFGTESPAAANLRNLGITVCKSIVEASQNLTFDLIWVSRISMMQQHYSFVREQFPASKVIFDTVDLHGLRTLREDRVRFGIESAAFDAQRLLRQEIHFANVSDATIVVSSVELMFLDSFKVAQMTRIISNIHERQSQFPKFEETSGIIFVGGFNHTPNVSAIKWFVEFVWPLLPDFIRQDGLTIAGSNLPEEIFKLRSEEIHPIGWVPDSVATVQQHRISIAPLTFGAGVKGKVGESFSSGVPVVLTDVAAEGMGVVHEKHGMIANSEQDFAHSIERLYVNKSLWHEIQISAADLIDENFSRECARREFVLLIEGLITQVDTIG